MSKFISTIVESLWQNRKEIGIRVGIALGLVVFSVVRALNNVLRRS